MADEFAINLMRLLAAELHLQNTPIASREMFGRGYLSLGLGEKAAVDQAVGARGGEPQGHRPANAARRSRDHGAVAVQVA